MIHVDQSRDSFIKSHSGSSWLISDILLDIISQVAATLHRGCWPGRRRWTMWHIDLLYYTKWQITNKNTDTQTDCRCTIYGVPRKCKIASTCLDTDLCPRDLQLRDWKGWWVKTAHDAAMSLNASSCDRQTARVVYVVRRSSYSSAADLYHTMDNRAHDA